MSLPMHLCCKMDVGKGGGPQARLLIYTDSHVQDLVSFFDLLATHTNCIFPLFMSLSPWHSWNLLPCASSLIASVAGASGMQPKERKNGNIPQSKTGSTIS